MRPLSDLVDDWGGFEELVAELHKTGTVNVERDIVLVGKSGAPRQCDVVVRHREGVYEHLIIVECKYWQKNVSRQHVDALTATVRDLNASKGVIMTAKGFQSGALQYAEYEGIDLFLIRELTDEEWGLPGRVINLTLQIVSRAIGNLQAKALASRQGASLPHLVFSQDERRTSTEILRDDGSVRTTLEDLIERASLDSLKSFLGPAFTINGGAEGTFYMQGTVNIAPKEALRLGRTPGIVGLESLSFDLGIRINQSQYTFDRGEKLALALAVENCISKTVTAATRPDGASEVSLAELKKSADPPPPDDEVFKNGSVLRVIHEGYFDYKELEGLTPVSVPGPVQDGVKKNLELLLDKQPEQDAD